MNRRKERKVTPVRAPKSPEVRYRRQLITLAKDMRRATMDEIKPVLEAIAVNKSRRISDGLVNDNTGFELTRSLDKLKARYQIAESAARVVASSFVGDVSAANRERLRSVLKNAIGFNMGLLVADAGVDEILQLKIKANVGLIKTIPATYFDKIESIVYSHVITGETSRSMIKDIMALGHSTEGRARVIARDQTAKLNSQLNMVRQTNVGIEEYIWLTADDGDRVRETHRKNNKKRFRWDSPPEETGHPGDDVQCRCIAQPILII